MYVWRSTTVNYGARNMRKRLRVMSGSAGGADEPGSSTRSPGIYKPAQLDRPLAVWSFEFELFEKLGKGTVLCDGRGPRIRKIWFVKEELPKYKDNFFTVHYAKEQGIKPSGLSGVDTASGYVDLQSPPPLQNQDDLDNVLELFEHMGSSMTYEYVCKAGWTSEANAREEHDKAIKEVIEKNGLLGSMFSAGDFIRAFEKGMSNWSGKAAIQAILNLAGVIAYGRDSAYGKWFACHTVGSSDPTEGFPVNEASLEFLTLDDIDMEESYDVEPFDSVSNVTSCASSASCTKKVYADAVLLSGCEPNWPHFVFVGEMKKTLTRGFCAEAVKQLQKEMLGTLMYQSLAFGIIMNDTVAIVCSMKQDFHEKKIFVSEDAYDFVAAGHFSFDQFKKMFLHIVNAINYGKTNIQEIDRGF